MTSIRKAVTGAALIWAVGLGGAQAAQGETIYLDLGSSATIGTTRVVCGSGGPDSGYDTQCVSRMVGLLTPDFGSSQASSFAMQHCKGARPGYSSCFEDAYRTFKPSYGASQALSMAIKSCE